MAKTATFIKITCSPSPSPSGQAVTFRAKVKARKGQAIPQGDVVFREGTISLYSATLDKRGRAQFRTTSLSAGNHLIIAQYQGSPNHGKCNSSMQQTVLASPLAISIVSSAAPGGTISGTVFYDINADQQFDNLESGIQGISVDLFKLPGQTKLVTTISGQQGSYQFAGLNDGDYLVVFPPTASFTPPGGTPISLVASDRRGTKAVGIGNAIGVSQIVNFGYKLDTACISGTVILKPSTTRCDGSSPTTKPENLPVTLVKDGIVVGQTQTDSTGYFEFQGLDCGNYSLIFPRQFQDGNLTLPNDTLPVGFVGPGTRRVLPVVTYDGPPGSVRGRVVLESGIGIGNVELKLIDPGPPAALLRTTKTDESGNFEFPNVLTGNYELDAPADLSSGIGGLKFPIVTLAKSPITVYGDVTVPDIIYRSGVLIDSIGNQFKQLTDAATTIASLSPTANQSAPVGAAVSPGAVGGLAYDQIIELNLAKVLGARPNSDPQRVQSLLSASFEKKEQNGNSYYVWRPRGATTLDVSTGGQLVGAQATLYGQAKDIYAAANRLLDAVFPILLDPDQGEIDAVKEDIRATLRDVTGEFGRTGGALLDRIDSLLPTLNANIDELEQKLGLVGTPPSVRVLDIAEEEQDRQNFVLLKSYITQLIGAKNQLNSNSFKGTLLTRLLWTIEVIPDTVRQVYSAMDEVGFGPADRRVTPIDNSATIATTIEQLLLWVETSASTDWPRRLVGGGARPSEIQAIKNEAGRQQTAVTTLTDNIGTIILIGAGRVQPLLKELGRELGQVATSTI